MQHLPALLDRLQPLPVRHWDEYNYSTPHEHALAEALHRIQVQQLVPGTSVPGEGVDAVAFAQRLRDQRGLTLAVSVMTLTAFLGLLWGPVGTSLWLWALLLGLGQGGSFALSLSMIVMRSGNAQVTAQLSAMAQGWGDVLAACGPLLVGVLRNLVGSYASAVWLVIALGIAMAISGWGAGRNLQVKPE